MSLISTTHGILDDSTLRYEGELTNQDDQCVAFVRWVLPNHDGVGCAICADPQYPKPSEQNEVEVRKDVWITKKLATVEASTVAAAMS